MEDGWEGNQGSGVGAFGTHVSCSAESSLWEGGEDFNS